ncbi:MAG TPA: ABC transporter permease [Chitinophagaceae bacterium]
MSFYLSLRAEMLKTRRTAAFYLTGIVASLLPLLYLVDFATDDSDARPYKADPWQLFFLEGWKGINFVILTWFVILLCTLLAQIEHRNNTWKQVFASPVPASQVFFSKFLGLQLLVVLFLVIYNTLMLASATALHFLSKELPFLDHHFDVRNWLLMNGKTYLAVLPISVIQFWLSLRFKNFIVPMGIGLALWLAGSLAVFEWHFESLHLFPYMYPLVVVVPDFKAQLPMVQASALVYTALFLFLALADFNGHKRKG